MRIKISDEKLAQAKDMYMKYVSVTEIASRLGLKRGSLKYHTGKWKSERVLRANETLSEFSDSKIALMANTFSDSFSAIQKWVAHKSKDPAELKPHEVKAMMSIITEMDKITRLDAGNPTDIIAETAPIDIIEVRKKILQADPFLEEADFKEITNDKEDTEEDVSSEVKDIEDGSDS